MRIRVVVRSLLTIAASVYLQNAAAATFSRNEGGLRGSYSVIHARGKGDYLSLREAAHDFSSYPGGARGNYTFFIASDTVEPGNVAFGNETNGYVVQLRPHKGFRTVTFTQEIPNSGFDGHLVFGASSVHTLESAVKMDRFVVNGYLPGQARALCFRNVDHSPGYPAGNRSVIINTVGDSDHVSIRNCEVENRLTSSTGFTYAINYTSALAGDGAALIPDHGVVHNCRIHATGWQGHGVSGHTQPGQSIPARSAQQGLTVTSCTINASSRGVLLNQSAGGYIRDNRVRVHNSHPGWNAQAIFHSASNAFMGGALEVTGNRVFASGAPGLATVLGIAQGEGIQLGHTDILNNMVVLSVAAPVHRGVTHARGIQFGTATSGVARAAHNSVLVKSLSGLSIALRAVTFYDPRPQIYNNILCTSSTESGMNLRINDRAVDSDGNIFSVDQGSSVGFDFAPPVTLEEWREISGQDLGSVQIDPRPHWVSDEDLHLAGVATELRRGVPLPGGSPVLTDINGRVRPPGLRMAGAHEPQPVIVPQEPVPLVTWTGTKLRNRKPGRLRLRARVTVLNIASEALPAEAALNVYVSDDEILSKFDTLLRSHPVAGLGPSKVFTIRKAYRVNSSLKGRFLLAVVENHTASQKATPGSEAVYGPLLRD